MESPGSAFVTLEDYRACARARLAPEVFDYIDGGAGDEITDRTNRRDLDRLSLLPFVLRDVAAPRLAGELLRQPVSFPLGFSPTAFHRLVSPEGEIAAARAAQVLGVPLIVSAMSSIPLEEITGQVAGASLWLQTYIFKDRKLTTSLVERAERAGFAAIVATVGVPAPGKRDRNLRNGFHLPEEVSAANFGRTGRIDFNSPIYSLAGAELDASITWRDLAWLCSITALPVVVKGLMNPRDVVAALELKLAAIMVSNHGGRQLDTSCSTIRALPEIVEAVGGRVPVLVDSGFRRGTDVLKALVLGAEGVFLGRPVMWALAAGGQAGVIQMTRLLADELSLSLQLAGCSGIAEARRDAADLLRWS